MPVRRVLADALGLHAVHDGLSCRIGPRPHWLLGFHDHVAEWPRYHSLRRCFLLPLPRDRLRHWRWPAGDCPGFLHRVLLLGGLVSQSSPAVRFLQKIRRSFPALWERSRQVAPMLLPRASSNPRGESAPRALCTSALPPE